MEHTKNITPSAIEFQTVPVATRSDGWTPERQRAFIEELADTGLVREAAARVGMSEQGARRLRRRPEAEAFSQAWDAAMRIGADRLRSLAYERAIEGTVRYRYYHGEVVGEERVFDNRLLVYLLGRIGDAAASPRAGRVAENWEAWMDAVEDGEEEPTPPPETYNSPVWTDEDGTWLTSFPPPEGFQGRQFGQFGAENYCRALSSDEREAIHAWERRCGEKEAKRRDAFFARLG